MKTYKLKEFQDICNKRYGNDKLKWRYKCPNCELVQTGQDLIDAGAGKDFDEITGYIGFSCIGRFNGSNRTIFGEPKKEKPTPKNMGCNYTAGGFLNLCNIKIDNGENEFRYFFDLDCEGECDN